MGNLNQAEIRKDIETIVGRVASRLEVGLNTVHLDVVQLNANITELKSEVTDLKSISSSLSNRLDSHILNNRAEHKRIVNMLNEDLFAINNDVSHTRQTLRRHITSPHPGKA
ncbi:hypothetical protein IPG36_05045 [bacterium]|nr:MAG: hypothetical protein IPG36_05045 [bacterium]